MDWAWADTHDLSDTCFSSWRKTKVPCLIAQTCLPLPVWLTGPDVSELAKSLTQALELQGLEVRRPHVRFFNRSRILWSSSLSGFLLSDAP
jgi:hypothetical protein